ncbi:flagellar hook-associated protein 3 FlgL [Sphingomonas vulcanisoli]|uniref:Flagellin n=1 Tax=Sphingomonas vulcanisoli TaxID=1658060 RepID=A0ABX0TU10_9SPHN|nr:flagellin [Sphingomonas vulcanisoli]NIJ08998.1 flagellar hook-associated protein 3 FlgL [Sphingomonas vulcanisoli]
MIGSTRYVSQAEINRQSRISSDITKLQASVSSGKRLSAASDDPVAAARIASINQTQANNTVYEANINTGASIASAADTQLASIQNALTRAKELVLNGRTDSSSGNDRNALATELAGIAGDITTASQANDPNGNPLFPTGTPSAIPISDSLQVTATPSYSSVFQGVSTAAGSKTIGDILSAAQTALTNGDNTGLSTSLDELDAAIAHVSTAQTDQGLREARFTSVKSQLQDNDTDLATERTGLEDTDLTYALSEIESKQTSLQAAQTVFAQSMKNNLFSLLA